MKESMIMKKMMYSVQPIFRVIEVNSFEIIKFITDMLNRRQVPNLVLDYHENGGGR